MAGFGRLGQRGDLTGGVVRVVDEMERGDKKEADWPGEVDQIRHFRRIEHHDWIAQVGFDRSGQIVVEQHRATVGDPVIVHF